MMLFKLYRIRLKITGLPALNIDFNLHFNFHLENLT